MDRANTGLRSTLDSTHRQPKTRTSLQKIVQIIVESAFIYTIASAMAFGSYKSNAQYITSAFVSDSLIHLANES